MAKVNDLSHQRARAYGLGYTSTNIDPTLWERRYLPPIPLDNAAALMEQFYPNKSPMGKVVGKDLDPYAIQGQDGGRVTYIYQSKGKDRS